MADSSAATLAALFGGAGDTSGGGAALNSFGKTVAQNDIFSQIAPAVLNAGFNRSTWSPTQNLVTSFAQALLGGGLAAYGRNERAGQLEKVASVLPSLYADPLSVENPGVDGEAFANLKLSALRENALEGLKDKKTSEDLKMRLFADVFSKNPGVAINTMPEIADKYGIKIPDAITAERNTPEVKEVAKGLGLENGQLSTQKKFQMYFQDNKNAGLPDVQAAAAARDQIAGEIKANSSSFDEAREARKFGQDLLDLSSTAKAGISKAGETGRFPGLSSGLDYIGANVFGLEGSKEKLEGDSLLNSIKPNLVKLSRSPGAISDREMAAYMQTGPSTENNPQTNAILAQKMEDIGKLNMDYADFVEAYRDANAGSTVGASKKWADYRKAFPIFTGEGENMQLNSNRPSWQEFFSGQVSPDVSANATTRAVNMDLGSFIAEAKRQGLSKEQAKARWAEISGGR